jgi:hypothetical protein
MSGNVVAWVALGVSVVAAVVALWQAYIARKALQMPVLVDMLHEFRSRDFKRAQRRVYTELRVPVPENGFDGLDRGLRADVLYVSHFYDNVGLLVEASSVDEKLVIRFLGTSAVWSWEALAPFISRQSEISGTQYQQCFKTFVARCPQPAKRLSAAPEGEPDVAIE